MKKRALVSQLSVSVDKEMEFCFLSCTFVLVSAGTELIFFLVTGAVLQVLYLVGE